MKKIILALAAAVMFVTGCGVGSYSTSTGKADEAYLSFTSVGKAYDINVIVDGTTYALQSVKTKPYRSSDMNIKQTSLNTIILKPGTHDVKVIREGSEVYSKKLFISAQEHKIVDL